MRAPPPVEYSCAPGPAGRAALSALVGLAAAVPSAWALPFAAAQWGGSPAATPLLQGGLALAVAVMTSGIFWLVRRRSGGGGRVLRWDGEDWALRGTDGRPERRGDAVLMLDLGFWMLVRFAHAAARRPRAATWLGLAARADASRWAAVRGALWNWRAGRGDARP